MARRKGPHSARSDTTSVRASMQPAESPALSRAADSKHESIGSSERGVDATSPPKPAPVIARSDELRKVEESERNLNFIAKEFTRAGPDAAINALSALLGRGYDPSEHSLGAVASVRLADTWIDRGKSFSGRKPGARAPETLYIERLVLQFPK